MNTAPAATVVFPRLISRLTRANYGNKTVSYTYDKVGNRTRLTSTTQGTTSYTYDGAGRRVKVTDSGGTRYLLYDGGI